MSTPLHTVSSLSTQNGSTALLVSTLGGHSEVVKLLLQAGARDLSDKVPLYQEHNNQDITYIHVSSQRGNTALSCARKEGHTKVVSILEQH